MNSILCRNKSLGFLAVLLCLAAFAGGCLPRLDPGPAPVRVRLNPAMPGSMRAIPLKQQITVGKPGLADDMDSDGVALMFNGRELRHLSDLRWSASLGSIIYDNLVAAIDSANVFSGVGSELAGLSSNYRLDSDISLFALVYESTGAPPKARFTGAFRLMDTRRAQIVASRQIDISVPAGATDSGALVVAMEKAFGQGLAEIAEWLAKSAR